MADYREIAKQYLENGLTTIPVGADKQSTINWTKYQDRHITVEEIDQYFGNCHGIAVLTGGLNQIECVDVDQKYSLTGCLHDHYKSACDPEILSKLWVQETRNKGYHWIYRTDVVEPNQKLASRETTYEEKFQTLMDNSDTPLKRLNAFKVAVGDKVRVLIETRGGEIKDGRSLSKGYFLVAPSPGYKKLFGKLNYLTDEERNHLVIEARKFNEYFTSHKNYKRDKIDREYDGKSPFEAFNENGDALELLFSHGWTEVGSGSSSRGYHRLRRPGNPDSKSSALYDGNTKMFNLFSTSSSLESGRPYSPSDLFIELEAGGDTTEAFKMLKELGY